MALAIACPSARKEASRRTDRDTAAVGHDERHEHRRDADVRREQREHDAPLRARDAQDRGNELRDRARADISVIEPAQHAPMLESASAGSLRLDRTAGCRDSATAAMKATHTTFVWRNKSDSRPTCRLSGSSPSPTHEGGGPVTMHKSEVKGEDDEQSGDDVGVEEEREEVEHGE